MTCSVPGSRYFHAGPAPASSSTEVIARSNSARAFAAGDVHARLRRALGPQIARADDKMAPARVERHLQVGIVDADQLGDDVRRHTEAFEIDGEMRKLAAQARGEHLVRALAHG